MATYYIDPTKPDNSGNGLTPATAKNTWVGLTLTANNTYRQKRGTTYVGASVRPASQSSSASTPLTIGAYYNADGSDDTLQPRPIIDHNGGTDGVGAVMVDTCTNVRVENIDGRNSRGSLGGGVTVRRAVGVSIVNCIGRDSEHGFVIQQDQADSTSVCTDVSITGVEAYNNVGGGICLRWGAVSTAILKRIAITGTRCYGNGTGKNVGANAASIPAGGIVSYTSNKASLNTAGFISYDIQCDDNIVYDNNGYGFNIEAFSNESWTSSVSNNDVYGNGASGDIDTHSIWLGLCSGIVVAQNHVHDNSGYVGASSGSGVGIFLDYNGQSSTPGENCIIRNNRIERQFSGTTTASAMAASAGVIVLVQNNAIVENNLIVDCRNGISLGNGISTDATTVRHNTIINSANVGISALPLATNAALTNNAIDGAEIGLFVNTTSTSGYAETYNSVSNCATSKANGTQAAPTATALDASDLTPADPLLSPSHRPLPGSPLIGAGAHLGYTRDLSGVRRPNPPSIGAFDVAKMRTFA